MDELELLKKDWKNQEGELPKLSYDQLYKMILKKSSSIVKWLLFICIAEFVLWITLDIVFKQGNAMDDMEQYGLKSFTIISYVISYGILFYFLVRFYINYKKIQVTDSSKVLMHNILRTRKTVKYYVWTNLGFLSVFTLINIFLLYYNESFVKDSLMDEVPLYAVIITSVIFIGALIGFLALFYRLIYGVLTRRLKKNYEELKKLEI